jgi:cysteine desulfurase
VTYVHVDANGRLDIEDLKNKITENTGLISVMMANNEIGTIQDIRKIAEVAHKHNILVHTDAVQALGKIPVDVKDLGVEFLSFSAHKIYGPKGVGGLYVKKGTPFCPLIRGGHQEMGRRAGTENTLGIIGLGEAVSCLKDEMEEDVKRILTLRNSLKQGIIEDIPDIRINGDQEHCLPNTLNVSFEGAEGEAILLYLDLEGIGVSTGSACSSGSLDPSHVLLATGLEAEQAHGSIRFSLGRENTEEDVEYVLEKLPQVIDKVRSMSTAYGKKK